MKNKLIKNKKNEWVNFNGILSVYAAVLSNITWTYQDAWPGAAYRSSGNLEKRPVDTV